MNDLTWRKSTYSDSSGGACVEVATNPATVHVRDSKRIAGPVLCLSACSWSGFLGSLHPSAARGRDNTPF